MDLRFNRRRDPVVTGLAACAVTVGQLARLALVAGWSALLAGL